MISDAKRAYNKAYYEKNADRLREKSAARSSSLYFSSASERARVSATRKEWREANPELAASQRRDYYLKNRERVKAQSREWNSVNAERKNSGIRAWRAANAGRVAAYTRSYQTAKRQARPSWADDEFEVFAIAEAYALAAMRTNIIGIPFEVDHIVPIAGKTVCGFHCIANLAVITKVENRKKCNYYWPGMP